MQMGQGGEQTINEEQGEGEHPNVVSEVRNDPENGGSPSSSSPSSPSTPSPDTDTPKPEDTKVPIEQLKIEPSKSQLDAPKTLITGYKLALLFVGLALAVFLAALDQTIVSTATPKITSELGGFDKYAWIATAYLLTTTAFQPLYGRFSDIFGRRPSLLFAIFIFELGSLLCAVSTNMVMLIISRAIAGIGGGGLMAMVMIIIADVVNLRERGKYQGIVGATFGLASVIGPLLGGAFTDRVTWRWCFYINLPFGAITTIVTLIYLDIPHTHSRMREKLLRIDYFGVATLIPAVVALLLATSWGGNTYAWDSAIVISLYVVAGVLAAAFILVEAFVAKEPIIPLTLFKSRNFVLISLVAFFIGFCMLGSLTFLPVYFQVVQGDSATSSGLRMLSLMLALVIMSMSSGNFIAKTGMYRFMPAFGTAILTLGMGVLSLLDENSSFGQMIGLLIPTGFGLGCLMQVILLVAQVSVQPRDIASATAAVNFFRTIGMVVGVASCGAVLNNVVNDTLSKDGFHGATDSFDVTTIKTLPEPIHHEIIHAFVLGIQQMFWVCIPFGGMGFISALGIKHIPLRKTLEGHPAPPPMMAE